MLRTFARGAAAGVTATTMVTGAVDRAERLGMLGDAGEPGEKGRLGWIFGEDGLGRVFRGRRRRVEREREELAAGIAPYALGGGLGAVFAIVAEKTERYFPTWLAGAIFGLLVWAATLLGVPARLLPPALRGRGVGAAISYGAWGALLGIALERRRGREARA